MPTQFFPANNDLNDWTEPFEEIGVSKEILKSAFSEHPPAFFYDVYQRCLRLFKSNPNITIQRWQLIALSGEPQRLYDLEIRQLTDKNGSNLLHYAAWSGSPEAITYVLEKCPELKDSNNNFDSNLLHYAAHSGSPEAIETVLEKCPELKDSKNKYGANLLHFAARSGSPEAITYVLKKCPELKDSKDNFGANLLHVAALSGSPEAIETVLKKCPELKDSKNKYGANLLHFAARSGSPEAITYVLEKCPELKDSNNNFDANLLHYAAWSGSPEAITYVLEKCPELKDSNNNFGANLLHYAASSGSCKVLTLILSNYPRLAASLWVKDNDGDTIDSYALKSKSGLKPLNVLKDLLKKATTALNEQSATENQMLLMTSFSEEWKRCLLEDEITLCDEALHTLKQNKNISQDIKNFLCQLESILKLKNQSLLDQPITLVALTKLHTLSQAAFNFKKAGGIFNFFEHKRRSYLFHNLTLLIENIRCRKQNPDAMLSADQAIVLNLLVDDFQRGLYHSEAPEIDRILINILLSSQTLQNLRPKPRLSQGRNISPDNFMEHFKIIKNAFATLNIKNDHIKETIESVILPGIEHLITHQDAIVEHTLTRYGVLYYLDPQQKLPMHTDHEVHQNETAYRKLLVRIIENLFGAYYMCDEAGKANAFFSRLCDGYCLEGRTRDLLEWAAKFSEVKPFDDFMQERIEEYLAFANVMQNKAEAEASEVNNAAGFIIRSYQHHPCQPHADYAPNGEVTRAGVEKYLADVLMYSDDKASSCVIS